MATSGRTGTERNKSTRESKGTGHLTGLEIIQQIRSGDHPPSPFATMLELHIDEASKGSVIFRGQTSSRFTNPMGKIHGGWYGSLLDSAMGCSVMTMLPAGVTYTTLEFKLNLVRPIPVGQQVYCEGKVIHCGRSTAVAEASIRGQSHELYAFATSTCMILS